MLGKPEPIYSIQLATIDWEASQGFLSFSTGRGRLLFVWNGVCILDHSMRQALRCEKPVEDHGRRGLPGRSSKKESIMDTRRTMFALLILMTLGVSNALGQYGAMGSRQDAPYPAPVATTTVTTYAPYYSTAGYPAVYSQPIETLPMRGQHEHARPPELQPVYADRGYARSELYPPVYAQPYAQAAYAPVQPAYAQVRPAYAQPAYVQAAYAQVRPAYAQPAYVQAAYAQPVYVSRPVVFSQPAVMYRPVVQTYTPTYAALPAAPAVTYSAQAYGQMPAAAAPVEVGPKVWVHPKVYVEGQPIRNLLKAITP
jgi:hypothetical protein